MNGYQFDYNNQTNHDLIIIFFRTYNPHMNININNSVVMIGYQFDNKNQMNPAPVIIYSTLITITWT